MVRSYWSPAYTKRVRQEACSTPTRRIAPPHRLIQIMSRALKASQAFSSTSLQHIERCLLKPQAKALRPTIACEQTPTPWAPADLFPPKASIMIPLLNVDGVPNLLVQIRAAALRVHAGEIR
jgi:hypothetical protein